MKLNLNQVIDENEMRILRRNIKVFINFIKYDSCQWDSLSIICKDDVELKYVVTAIEDDYIELKQVMEHTITKRLFDTVVGNVEGCDYIIVKYI